MNAGALTFGRAPGALPVLGHAAQLLHHPVEFLSSLSEHGDLVEIRMGTQPVYVTCHPEILWQVLADDRTFDKGGPYFDAFRDMMGNGLGTCPHADHRAMRRSVQPAFTSPRVEHYSSIMCEEISALSDSWHDGQILEPLPILFRLAMRIVARTLFSEALDDATLKLLHTSLNATFGSLGRRMLIPAPLRSLPLPGNRRYAAAQETLNRTLDRIITDHQHDGGGLLSVLGDHHDGEMLRNQVITVLLGGTETVSILLSWALYLLAEHPELERRLHAEVDTVLEGRAAQWDDLPDLPFTDRFITETLRLYPPGWLVMRLTTREVKLAGRTLPPATTILPSPLPVHRRASVYPDPDRFDPDRFDPERDTPLPRGAFTAFGGGARKCIGDTYGMTEATLALATLTARWRTEVVPGVDLRPPALATLYHARNIRLRLHARPSRE